MKSLQEFDAAIFERASKIIAMGEEQPPIVIVLMIEEGDTWHVIDVSQAMSTEHGKDIVSELINMLANRDEIAVVSFISEAWMLMGEHAKDGKYPRPSAHPERVECVVVSYSLASGKRALSIHKIIRAPGVAAVLERGELRTEEGGNELDGRFFAERRTTH